MAGVNFSARELVDSAKKAGHDTKAIAKLCNVAESSVRRWRQLGKADADAIKPLMDLMGPVNTPKAVSATLIRMYKKNNAFRMSWNEFRSIVGRKHIRYAFLSELREYLEESGYLLIEACGTDTVEGEPLDDCEFLILVSVRKLMRIVPDHLADEALAAE